MFISLQWQRHIILLLLKTLLHTWAAKSCTSPSSFVCTALRVHVTLISEGCAQPTHQIDAGYAKQPSCIREHIVNSKYISTLRYRPDTHISINIYYTAIISIQGIFSLLMGKWRYIRAHGDNNTYIYKYPGVIWSDSIRVFWRLETACRVMG